MTRTIHTLPRRGSHLRGRRPRSVSATTATTSASTQPSARSASAPPPLPAPPPAPPSPYTSPRDPTVSCAVADSRHSSTARRKKAVECASALPKVSGMRVKASLLQCAPRPPDPPKPAARDLPFDIRHPGLSPAGGLQRVMARQKDKMALAGQMRSLHLSTDSSSSCTTLLLSAVTDECLGAFRKEVSPLSIVEMVLAFLAAGLGEGLVEDSLELESDRERLSTSTGRASANGEPSVCTDFACGVALSLKALCRLLSRSVSSVTLYISVAARSRFLKTDNTLIFQCCSDSVVQLL